mgnify:FL=1
MKNKYYFFKRLYKDYVIIFIDKNNNLKSMFMDTHLIKYIKNNDINYISITNDFEINITTRKNNRYYEYLIKEFILNNTNYKC